MKNDQFHETAISPLETSRNGDVIFLSLEISLLVFIFSGPSQTCNPPPHEYLSTCSHLSKFRAPQQRARNFLYVAEGVSFFMDRKVVSRAKRLADGHHCGLRGGYPSFPTHAPLPFIVSSKSRFIARSITYRDISNKSRAYYNLVYL